MSNLLDKICIDTRLNVERSKCVTPLETLKRQALRVPQPRSFALSLRNACARDGCGFIAEIKRASPSAGIIRANFSPADLATSYEKGGAACLSVLTDGPYFQGCKEDLIAARSACALPVLRKDFILDVWQVAEARSIGADCILLIMAALDDATAAQLHEAATGYGMDVLIEVHTADELQRALLLPSRLIGINSRNLKTMKVDLVAAAELVRRVPIERFVISESGIRTPLDVQRMKAAGARGFLVGETLLKEEDPGAALRTLRH